MLRTSDAELLGKNAIDGISGVIVFTLDAVDCTASVIDRPHTAALRPRWLIDGTCGRGSPVPLSRRLVRFRSFCGYSSSSHSSETTMIHAVGLCSSSLGMSFWPLLRFDELSPMM